MRNFDCALEVALFDPSNSVSNTNLLGVVLAGGQSRRMGQRKELLRLRDGTTMLERMLRILRPVTDLQVISGLQDNNEPHDIALPSIIPDQAAFTGPLGGIIAVTQCRKASGYLFVACDQPRLTKSLLEILLSHGTEVPTCFQSKANDFIEPIPCFLPSNVIGEISAMYQRGERSVSKTLQTIGAHAVKLSQDEFESLRGVNTKEEFDAL